MQSIVLISDPTVSLGEWQDRLSAIGQVRFQAPSRMFVFSGVGRIIFNKEDSVRDDYDPEELLRVPIAQPQFFLVEYDDLEELKRVLIHLTDDERVWVDNDHGLILPGPAFVRKLRNDPSWDWRDAMTTSETKRTDDFE